MMVMEKVDTLAETIKNRHFELPPPPPASDCVVGRRHLIIYMLVPLLPDFY